MGGVGKTRSPRRSPGPSPATSTAVIWRSLLNAPPLEELLRPVLQAIAGPNLAELPAGLDAQLALLLDGLRRQRCLLILDNLESLLDDRRRHDAPGLRGYGQLLHRLAQVRHSSCLLLTSRERPAGPGALGSVPPRCGAAPGGARPGRRPGDPRRAGAGRAGGRRRALVERYSGHPLALKLVAQTVHELFGGEIGEFLREETPIFDDIRTVLDQQFARLSALEQELLYWLAIEREATTAPRCGATWCSSRRPRTFVEALRALQRRSLLERVGDGLHAAERGDRVPHRAAGRGVCAECCAPVTCATQPADEEQRTLPDTLTLLNRFALVKAQAKEYVRESQTRMILQPVVDRLVAGSAAPGWRRGRRRSWPGCARGAAAPATRAATCSTCCCSAGIDVAGYDFSGSACGRPTCRASWRRVSFGAADLTGSDLYA